MNNAPGTIGWIDLTVDDGTAIKDFYREVVGWKVSEFELGEYSDYCVAPADSDQPVAGICHRRGPNADMPSQWLIYVTVADLDHSLERVIALGGQTITEKRDMGSYGNMCVIRDPAGAVMALIQPPAGD